MALWTWWSGDPLPGLATLPDLTTDIETDVALLTRLSDLDELEVVARLNAGHRAHVAKVGDEPVAYGWVATLGASIGELGIEFNLPPGDRYLWDFVTLPGWRGRGIYPRLLQAILERERPAGQRFWIINAPENAASGAGIAKAGFREVSELAFLSGGGAATLPAEPSLRAQMGAALLGVPLLEAVGQGRVISPCWRCVISARADGTDATCWPYQTDGTAGVCNCA